MNTTIVSIVVTTLLLLGSGLAVRTIFVTIERITLTRIKKGLSSSERLAQALTGKKLVNGKLQPLDESERKYSRSKR